MSHAIPGPDAQHEVVSARDAALALGLSERTIRRAIARGELMASKQGRAFHITAEALARYRTRLSGVEQLDAPVTVVRFPEPATPFVLTAPPPLLRILPAPLSRFVGRDREAAVLSDLLRQDGVRLVTLIGPGGVGKTRLVLHVAQALVDHFAGSVAFISLSAIGSPELVLATIARDLGVREAPIRPLRERLVSVLGDRRLLLVLDNFEHLLPAASDIAGLLTQCPRLTMLVTSREPLRLSGERRFPLSPMALPGSDDVPAPDQLSSFEAIALFVERARQVQPDFTLDAGNASTVLAICSRLDGLPLAIELAAAWLRILSPAALLSKLERRLPLLTGGASDQPARLRTMYDAIAWSHGLLSEEERRFMCHLSVFVGGFTLDAAEWVTEGRDD